MAADVPKSSPAPASILGRLWATTPTLTAPDRLRVFELLPVSMQRQAFSELEREARKAWK
jgi:hypothetical protein